ncbi:hypothetical protein G6321_00023830 [Bradyrhizobium barranii subsp. barranii]|uniref:Uncharacterized protein n=1 Tax=Bradyrhizobium barranii subsp. barranii TaxID=2823807 RepID=A0A7Z0QKQ1_9BRAD|nr:hypothetical protein [Bradyrhizobium barranii]UGX97993.1 hypothetical protein G6321_00023830 [Bradyrhizobium barranii subsp. barranii]
MDTMLHGERKGRRGGQTSAVTWGTQSWGLSRSDKITGSRRLSLIRIKPVLGNLTFLDPDIASQLAGCDIDEVDSCASRTVHDSDHVVGFLRGIAKKLLDIHAGVGTAEQDVGH